MEKNKRPNIFKRIFNFYYQGFRDMPRYGVQLWILILLKLFIMFAILKIFFFPDILETQFDSDEEKSKFVIEQLTKPNK
ncbi:MAG TPA: DUF4492 domain-containing protein [Salinivirga sp.]|uniref:DUF4492 domain-containing protein n=1 Tax=Salinivirga sp. TaxID=1970192 RepID=UPI002B49B36E|nr:DUF4492 domain-containing protein [Salinivirga sp.]HKK59904.1 DUF4492 domain-containing protein [Salinivirga sp.]